MADSDDDMIGPPLPPSMKAPVTEEPDEMIGPPLPPPTTGDRDDSDEEGEEVDEVSHNNNNNYSNTSAHLNSPTPCSNSSMLIASVTALNAGGSPNCLFVWV